MRERIVANTYVGTQRNGDKGFIRGKGMGKNKGFYAIGYYQFSNGIGIALPGGTGVQLYVTRAGNSENAGQCIKFPCDSITTLAGDFLSPGEGGEAEGRKQGQKKDAQQFFHKNTP